MSKIIVDSIQKTGVSKLKLPLVAPQANQILASDVSDPTQLVFVNKPGNTVIPSYYPSVATYSPFIFARQAGYQSDSSGNWGWTSEQGQWYSGYGQQVLQAVTSRTSYGNSNGANYANYPIPPRIEYLSGSNGHWGYVEDQKVYADTSNRYNYPDKLMSVVFVKNTTGANITSTFSFSYASYWNSGYEGSAIYLGTPDATNTQIAANSSAVTTISYSGLHSGTSNTSNTATTVSVTVPADKTVAIICYNSGKYYTSSNNYVFFNKHEIYDFYSIFMQAGLEVDAKRTFRALQNPLETSSVVDIWQ
jgi:hypothetical protein